MQAEWAQADPDDSITSHTQKHNCFEAWHNIEAIKVVPDKPVPASSATSASASADTSLQAVQRRPGTASNHKRPLTAAGHNVRSAGMPSTSHSSNNAPPIGTHRPRSAAHGSNAFSCSSAALARLKADLAQLAAVGNVQLQSLRSRSGASKAAADSIVAVASSDEQVLEQLQQLEQNVGFTYTEARAAASAAAMAGQQQAAQATAAVVDASNAVDTVTAVQPSITQPETDDCGSGSSSSSECGDSKDALSAFVADLQLTADEKVAAAAAAALKEMRGWVAEQDMRMVEPSVAARVPNKTVAARISMLQSETQVLQYQRQFYEKALADLRASSPFRYHTHMQQQQQSEAAGDAANSDEECNEHPTLQGPRVTAAVCHSPNKQKLHHNHSFSGWAAAFASETSQQASPCSYHSGTKHQLLRQESAGSSSLHDSYYSEDEDPNTLQEQQSDPGGKAAEPEQRDKRTGRRLEAYTAITACATPRKVDDGTGQQADNYFGSNCLHSRISLRRSVSHGSDVLQLSHSGLRPQQLDKVSAALTAAPWIRKLDLSGNVLTDAAIFEVSRILLTNPEARKVTHIDLSQNQLLTWHCCLALAELLQADSIAADSLQQQQRDVSTSGAFSMTSSLQGSISGILGCTAPLATAMPAARPVSSSGNTLQQTISDDIADSSRSAAGGQDQLEVGISPALQEHQPLYLWFLSLEGIVLGDKGAAALTAALLCNKHLQVLCVGRCGLRDSGGAAICAALLHHPTLAELDLSWNALSHKTAKAVEAAFKCPSCRLGSLSMSHCGLTDRDASLILDSLLPDFSIAASGSVSGTSSTGGGPVSPRHWTCLDLSYNTLEGGAALVAAAVITAIEGSSASTSSSFGGGCAAHAPRRFDSGLSSSSGVHSPRTSSRRLVNSSIIEGDVLSKGLAARVLLLDGNPLGASGVKSIMRALAGQPAVALLWQDRSVSGSGHGSSGGGASRTSSHDHMASTATQGFFLQDDGPVGDGGRQHSEVQRSKSSKGKQQQLQPLRLHVGIAKVALMAKERGFRNSLRDTQTAAMLTSQVPTLVDALVQSGKTGSKGPPNTSGNTENSKKNTASKSNSSKAAASQSAAQAAAQGASNGSSTGVQVVTETAAGFDLYCPAGQYKLGLTHPSVRHMLVQLLELRTRLHKLQQQLKQEQEQATVNASAKVAVSSSSTSGAKAVGKAGSNSGAATPGSSRSTSPVPPTAGSTSGGGASPLPGSSRRASGTGSTEPCVDGTKPSTSQSSTKSGVPVKRRFFNCQVDVLSLVDIKLDGKLVRLEQLLQLHPWRKQPGQADNSSSGAADTAVGTGNAAAGQAAAAASNDGTFKKGKRPRSFKFLEFTVKAAAVLAGQEAPVLPAQLLQWALQVLSDPSSSEVWKLQLIELLVPDWLLLPEQAVQLLDVFDKELGQEEKLSAAGLLWARLVQPMAFWEQVLPLALKPLQQNRFKAMLGSQLMTLDRQNLTGAYVLNLGWSVHRAVAHRLQIASLQDIATAECRYYLSWRNASLNCVNLRDDAAAHLQAYAVPPTGTLKLDYVSYQVPDGSSGCTTSEQLCELLAGLRQLQGRYFRHLLELRNEYLPGGVRRSEEEEKQAAAKARMRKSVRNGVMAAKLGCKTAAADSATTTASAQNAVHATGATVACSNASGNVAGHVDSADAGVAVARHDAAWWEACGLDPTALLLKYQDADVPGLAALLSGRCPTLLSGQTRSRRSTRELDAGVIAAAQAGYKAPSRTSQNSSTNKRSSRPSSAAPGNNSRPASADVPANARSRTGRNSKAAQPKSSLASGSTNGGSGAAGATAVDRAAAGLSANGVTDEQLLARLLVATSPKQAASAFALMGPRHAASVMKLLGSMPQGAAAVAALLECLSPVVAARCWQDVGHEAALLPQDLRSRVEPLLRPALAEVLQEVGASMSQAATNRWNQQLLLVRKFAAQVPGISCSQLGAILSLLGVQGQANRCGVIVALWVKVTDRHRLVEVFEALSGSEQLGLMSTLGSYHVWATLARPDGLHFRLDLTVPEQRDVAREVVRVAVRKSLAERGATGQRVRQLENFTAEGKPVADPEDEKLWLAMESKHTLLEFDFAKTWDQELHAMVGAVKRIQRAWRKLAAKRGCSTPTSLAASSANNTRPASPATSATAAAGLTQGRTSMSQTDSSFFSSYQESSYSYFTGTASSNATPYTATTDSSSFMYSPLSLSGYMSDADASQAVGSRPVGAVVHQATASPVPNNETSYAARLSSSSCSPEASSATHWLLANPSAGAAKDNMPRLSVGLGSADLARRSSIDLMTGLAQHQAAVGVTAEGSSVRPTPRLAG